MTKRRRIPKSRKSPVPEVRLTAVEGAEAQGDGEGGGGVGALGVGDGKLGGEGAEAGVRVGRGGGGARGAIAENPGVGEGGGAAGEGGHEADSGAGHGVSGSEGEGDGGGRVDEDREGGRGVAVEEVGGGEVRGIDASMSVRVRAREAGGEGSISETPFAGVGERPPDIDPVNATERPTSTTFLEAEAATFGGAERAQV